MLRAIWRDVPLNVGCYRVDVVLWGYDVEIENLIGLRTLTIAAHDVYGTGRLPDPSFQGVIVPQASWTINGKNAKALAPLGASCA